MQTQDHIAMAKENISKATVQLIQNHPFFACLAMRLTHTPAEVKKSVTDGTQLFYNPEYFSSLSIDELQGVIGQLVMHLATLHHTRRNNRDMVKWNKAADYAINPLLKEAKFTLPEGALDSPEYAGMSAEQIYGLLHDPDPDGEQPEEGFDPGIGDFQDPPAQKDVQEMEADMKEAVSMAAMMGRRAGQLTEGMDRFIQNILESKVDWRAALARFLTEIVPNDYTWTKPSKRYQHMGLFLPTLESTEPGGVILIVDTSKSINKEMLNQVGSEAKEIADTFHIDLSVIYVDTVVQSVQHIDRDDPMELDPKGDGGTDFRPGFEYIEENDLNPKAVIYLTDGECSSFPEAPHYAVLWTLFKDSEFDPPFGEVLVIE